MREQIQKRIEALKKELETGQAALQNVERQRTYLHETALRITGAIQVMEELLAESQSVSRRDAEPVDVGIAKDN